MQAILVRDDYHVAIDFGALELALNFQCAHPGGDVGRRGKSGR